MDTPPTTKSDSLKNSGATELLVGGMNCNNCARHVTEAIQSVSGVRSATVILDAGCASVRWNSGTEQNVSAVIEAVQKAGYSAKEIQTDTSAVRETKPANWQINLWLGITVTAALMMGEWGFHLAMTPWFQWLAFALAGVVQVFAGAKFYRGAWNQLKIGNSNMDTLVALGSTTAFGYSAWALLGGLAGHLYFMEAAAIITFVSFGHWLEARVSAHASGALENLLNLAPETARKLVGRADLPVGQDARQRVPTVPDKEVEIPVSELKIGDLVALRPGDRVPVDGVVDEGDSAVDEAMLTGESVPVDKNTGSELYTGTVNLNGRLVMRVTATGESTALAHIIAAVQRAQASRADIQRLGDQVSSVFVPVVVAIAVVAALGWGFLPESAKHIHDLLAPFLWHVMSPADPGAGFIIAAAVLIVACPCAMGLATPAAIMAAANTAARRGILIRDGIALEKAGKVTAVVLDKTGTLTSGELAVVGPWTPNDSKLAIQQAQIFAAALARQSNHPVSKILACLADELVPMENWKEIPGSGVQAQLTAEKSAQEISRLGSLPWLRACGIDIPENEKQLEHWKDDGAALVGLSRGNFLLGIFALRDFLKPNALKVIWQLQGQGLKTFLLTGDNPRTALAVANQVNITPDNVFAEVRPEQKAEFVKKLQAQGERVAFVGDGINDAPALEQADLGVAVSRASDLAREAADIILLKSEIEAVPEALGLARATLRTIRQNLFWAFFYNALGVPLAALGFISPILCAAAMGVSDLIVIGNALRLLRWR
ncbi:MAG: cation-translocating P-type ATPase [Verrucomicrobiia bacterium]|jgi:Cu+-exporting ATPase